MKGKGKAEPVSGEDSAKKVTFAEDTKPPANGAESLEKAGENTKLDGVAGQLEIYESGAVKMRLKNGIVMDVRTLLKVPSDRKSTRLNSSHSGESRMPSSA